ncbi:MAG: cytosine deaminase-like protein [Rhodospirillales bacterium]|nr:cytosine deaminase-like protein [Rhodospirillales bacterium]
MTTPIIPDSGRFRLRNCTIPDAFAGAPGAASSTTLVDFIIDEGLIVGVTPSAVGLLGVEPAIDLDRRMACPCFADLHTHLDKGYIWPRAHDTDGRFANNLAAVARDRDARWSADDVRSRMDFGLRCAYAHGTHATRTHIDSTSAQAHVSWGVFREMRREWRDRITLQAVSLVPIDDLRDIAAAERLADLVAASDGIFGAFLYPIPDLDVMLDRLFDLAERHGLDLDVHVDETDDPQAKGLHALARAALRHRFGGKIVAGHCCSLALHDDDQIKATLDLVAAAGIAIVSLPLTNLHMQDRRPGRTPRWRGITLLHEFAARGIPVALANDNVRDPFYAYGDYDMVELYRIATLAGQLDYPADSWLKAITTTPSSLMGLSDRPLAIGRPADLVLFSARSHDELIARPQSDRIVLRRGRRLTAPLPDFRELDRLIMLPLGDGER